MMKHFICILLSFSAFFLQAQNIEKILSKAAQSEAKAAIKLYDSAANLSLRQKDSIDYLKSLHKWSELLIDQRQIQPVIERLEKAQLQHFSNYPEQQYNLLKIFNRAHGLLSHHESVLEISKQLLDLNYKLYDDLNDDRIDFTYYIGMMQANLFIRDEGLKNLKEALALSIQKNGELNERTAILYNNIGLVYKSICDYDNAIVFYEKTLELLNEFDAKNYSAMATITNNLAGTFKEKGQFDKALELSESAESYLQLTDRPNPAIYIKKGQIYSEIGEYDLALKNFIKSTNIVKSIYPKGHPRSWNALSELALGYVNTGQYDSALFYFNSVLDYSKNFEELNIDLFSTHLGLGDLYLQKSKYMESIKNYNRAIQYIEKDYLPEDPTDTPIIEFVAFNYKGISLDDAISKKGDALYHLGVNTKSKELLEKSLRHYELGIKIYNRQLTASFSKQQAFSLAAQRQANYKGALRVCHKLYSLTNNSVYAEKAFEIIENSKAAVLYQNVISSSIKMNNDPDSLITQLEQTKNQFNESLIGYKELKLQYPDSAKNLRTQLISHQLKIESLNWEIRKGFRNFYALELYDSTLINTRNSLFNTALIQYFEIKPGSYYAIAISQKDILFKEINTKDILISSLMNSASITVENKLYKLHNSLILPLAPAIGDLKKLIIIPDGQLNSIPFEALRSSNDEYLIQQYQISYHYSSKLLSLNSSNNRDRSESVIAYAPTFQQISNSLLATRSASDSIMNDKLVKLPEAENEAQYIVNLFAGQLKTGTIATESDFKINSSNFDIIHLATHAVADSEEPMLSKLIFSNDSDSLNDGILYAYEMHKLNLNANLVSLSACNTGVGKYYEGEGVMSLAWSFMYAGVPNVMMSLWSVPDKSTSEIMQGFYKYLKDGYDKPAALRQAKLDYLANADQNTSLPYFWAGFVFIGNVEADNSFFEDYWLPLTGLAVSLLLFGLFYYRKKRA